MRRMRAWQTAASRSRDTPAQRSQAWQKLLLRELVAKLVATAAAKQRKSARNVA